MNTKCKLFKQLNVSGIVVVGNGNTQFGTLAFYDSPECRDIPCVEILISAQVVTTAIDAQENLLIQFTSGCFYQSSIANSSDPNIWIELNGALYFHLVVLLLLGLATIGLSATKLYQFFKLRKLSFSASVICLAIQFCAGIRK